MDHYGILFGIDSNWVLGWYTRMTIDQLFKCRVEFCWVLMDFVGLVLNLIGMVSFGCRADKMHEPLLREDLVKIWKLCAKRLHQT